jgi:predicted XRE-type DNA-binding protein
MSNEAIETIECYEGSGNVFADIGLKDADELYARACIGIELDIGQSEVSHLMNGHFSRFSEGKLLGFLKKLDREVTLVITQPDQRHGISLSL